MRPAPASRTGVLQLEPGPRATALASDPGPLRPRRPQRRPRQGRLGDCWLLAPMLAIHETAPDRLPRLVEPERGGVVAVHLPGVGAAIRVDRRMPVDARGRFVYARLDGGNPSWAGVLEKAVAGHLAGSYRFLQRGVARFGLELLLGSRVRTLLRLPAAAQIHRWRQQHRALCASTHPLSVLVSTEHGRLPPNHVFAVVGAEPATGHVLLRNPVRPADLLRIDARSFRRGFLSMDVSEPLR